MLAMTFMLAMGTAMFGIIAMLGIIGMTPLAIKLFIIAIIGIPIMFIDIIFGTLPEPGMFGMELSIGFACIMAGFIAAELDKLDVESVPKSSAF